MHIAALRWIHTVETRFLVKEVHFLLTNGGSGWIHRIGTGGLIKKVHLLLTNGGSGWIHGIGTRFLVKYMHFFINKWKFRLDSRGWNEVFG